MTPRRTGITSTARWTAGTCSRCQRPISEGDRITRTSAGWDHLTCPVQQHWADSLDGEVLAEHQGRVRSWLVLNVAALLGRSIGR